MSEKSGQLQISIRNRHGYPEVNGSWTDGTFEFKVTLLLNGKNGVGNELVTYFPAPPRSLFRVRRSTPAGEDTKKVRLAHLRTKRMKLDLPLFKWDLQQYASSVKIEVEEVDRTETIATTDTRTVSFAGNFGFDVGFGQKVKIGLKFGLEGKKTETSSITKTTTLDSDKLGGVIVNFADKCVKKNGDNYRAGTVYEAGWFELELAPRRVQ